MLVIWGRSNSVNVQKVLWCCEELGVAYDRIDAGGPYGVVDTPEYRRRNPNGLVPTIDAIDRTGLAIDDPTMARLLGVDAEAWQREVALIEAHFAAIGDRLPAEMTTQLDALSKRLVG